MKKQCSASLILLLVTLPSLAQFEVPWHTLDGGGVSEPAAATSANFLIQGTIGQGDAGPEAGPMTSVSFAITGGFWQFVPTCPCPGDMNSDGLKNGGDIQQFVNCLINGGSCSCADLDGQNGPDLSDTGLFVTDLLNPTPCN